MQPHGKILLAIGLLGTFLIVASTAGWSPTSSADGTPDSTPVIVATMGTSTPISLTPLAPTPTVTPTFVPVVEVVPTATPQPNRFSCTAIRGSNYLSGDERIWFRNNC